MNDASDSQDPAHEPDDEGLPLNANGAAYTLREDRHGVPLVYVAEKLGSAVEALHSYGQRHPEARDELMLPMYYLLVSHLGLHNMLGKANDHSLTARLLNGSRESLEAWLQLLDREGDVQGLAALDDDS